MTQKAPDQSIDDSAHSVDVRSTERSRSAIRRYLAATAVVAIVVILAIGAGTAYVLWTLLKAAAH